ncbi:MAG: hypothetical protein JXA00_03330 [Candidatus Thermoplasmatota archaeon]|nr:hypothetical protein [Candidatus Thermoplasmatota archaeon]
MMKKTMCVSSGAAVLLILASLSSVIGVPSSQPESSSVESPLFAVRTAQSTAQHTNSIIARNYLGRGKTTNFFQSGRTTLQAQLDKAFQLLQNNPILVKGYFKKITTSPQVRQLLQSYGYSVADVERYFDDVRQHPELLHEYVSEVDFPVSLIDSPQPLGLSTSSALGCFITVLVFIPLAITLGLVIATITLVTCLNIGGCFEAIVTQLLYAMIQELH